MTGNMKTVFDKSTREELINRIKTLNENCTAQWGKMTVYQMMKHCTLWEDMALARTQYPRVFIGRIFGKVALKSILKDDSPLRRNTPSIPGLKVSGEGSVPAQKLEWIAKIEYYAQVSNLHFIHPFFGEMTTEKIGLLDYKHIDHHLRQFGS
jgi:hypothetical protein